ncbi:MAG: hypothetical protein HC828_19480 [Blastochloris sp.]|nr:hypothetical protein [Blastochloris sp.]
MREAYPAPGYNLSVLPHTHNELLQVATDAGLPGLALYLAMYGAIVYMLVQTWRRGDFRAKAVAASVGAGLLAHNFFALGDAITLWDRFIMSIGC